MNMQNVALNTTETDILLELLDAAIDSENHGYRPVKSLRSLRTKLLDK